MRRDDQGVNARLSYLAVHMDKFHKQDIKGLQIHHQRERESQSNTDIDYSKSNQNYDLHNPGGKIDFKKEIDRKIAERVDPAQRIRKDAVLLNSFIVTSDRDYFDRIGPKEERRFFQESYNFLANRYGKENLVNASVHKDEKTPHMHVGLVPITEKGRLSSRQLFSPAKLQKLQTDFHQHIKSRGFDLERGIPGKQKHEEPRKYKVKRLREEEKTLQQKVGDMSKRAESIKNTLDKAADIAKRSQNRLSELREEVGELQKEQKQLLKEVEPLRQEKAQALNINAMEETAAGFFGLDQERIKVKKKDWEQLKSQAIQMPRLLGNMQQVGQENQLLGGHLQRMGEQMQGMRQELAGLREFAEQYKDAPELEKYVESLELKLDLIEEELGIEFDLEPDLDGEELDDEDQPRQRRRRSPKYKLRRRIRRNGARHQNVRRPGRRKDAREQKRPKPKREHGQIIDKGRF